MSLLVLGIYNSPCALCKLPNLYLPLAVLVVHVVVLRGQYTLCRQQLLRMQDTDTCLWIETKYNAVNILRH